MKSFIKGAALTMMMGAGIAGTADAAEILVASDIASSTVWTADNTYNLQTQIYVLPGATLTIEAGTVIASDTGVGGSLAVTRGAQILAKGTADEPIIFTSKADVETWNIDLSHPTGGDPKTGAWRESALEWGNLTLMGRGYISENAVPGNESFCDSGNEALMEGLVESVPGDPNVRYGGGDDGDDSGSLEYVSFRYGGRIVALTVELNGLSLGGIGADTDIRHIEIMNNVDDGIEIWGGCVNLKWFSIWNVGDDSFDVDQGWRGKAQFGLIVQGHSLDASQGSGVGDNCFETDGAEDSDWQPVTTATIYNATVIGQPNANGGDGGTAWRDGARVQYRNSIFMDLGDQLVRFDNLDGDGANGYGFNGSLTWNDCWTTPYDMEPAQPNACESTWNPQFSGNLCEISDSVFFRNLTAGAYTEATTRGVLPGNATNNNVLIPGFDPADQPIQAITRSAPVTKGGKIMLPVTYLDPRPANEALTSIDWAPDGNAFSTDKGYFWTAAKYRGAFAPDMNWLCGWTASQAFGFTPDDCQWRDIGKGLSGAAGQPLLSGTGPLTSGSAGDITLRSAAPFRPCIMFLSLSNNPTFAFGGYLYTVPILTQFDLFTSGSGDIPIPFIWPAGVPAGFTIYAQYGIDDPAAFAGVSLSNGLAFTAQ